MNAIFSLKLQKKWAPESPEHLIYLVGETNMTFSNIWHILSELVAAHNDADITMNIKLIIYWLQWASMTCFPFFVKPADKFLFITAFKVSFK